MKLATYRDGSRDGQLVVVSRDLATAHYASGIATRLQQVLDDWNFMSPQLQDLSHTLNHGKPRHAFAFDPRQCLAPLPRAYQRVGVAACLNQVASVRDSRRAHAPEGSTVDPPMFQGASDDFSGACDDIVCASEDHGIEFGAELAVITGDVPLGTTADDALESVRLLMLANEVSLRYPMAAELAKGLGFLHGKPATAFGPVAVTPDELGAAWQGGRVHLNLECVLNGKRVDPRYAGPDLSFHFGQLVAHLAKTRKVRAGSIVGSGAASNPDASRGAAFIAEKSALETIDGAAQKTTLMRFGDTVRLEMKGVDGMSVFGAIEQRVAQLA